MASKDKLIGLVLVIAALALIFLYTVMGPIDRLCEQGAIWHGTWLDQVTSWRNIFGIDWEILVIFPMWLVVVVIGVIVIWIGISMITTPPPVPLEELEEELEAEEAAGSSE